jgi:hypothetical protein
MDRDSDERADMRRRLGGIRNCIQALGEVRNQEGIGGTDWGSLAFAFTV